MMKKRLAAALAVTMMAGMLSTTAFAAGSNNTDVTVKVSTTAPDQMSVTVPTTLAIAVIGETGNASNPSTLIGSSFTEAGEMQGAGETAGVGALTFSNASKTGAGADMAIKIDSATVKNNVGSKWTLTDTTVGTTSSDKWKMNLSINDKKAAATPGNDSSALAFENLTIAGGKDKAVTVKAAAGGAGNQYEAADEGLNKAFTVEWSISKAN